MKQFFVIIITVLTSLFVSLEFVNAKDNDKNWFKSRLLTRVKEAFIAVSDPEKEKPIKVDVKHHNIYAANTIEGPGREEATSYDTSIYEAGLYAQTELFNGSAVSRNNRYPVTTSTAFTSNSWVDITASLSSVLTAGASLRLYTMSDSDYDASRPGQPSSRTGRVFGVMLPPGNYTALVGGLANPPGIPVPSPNMSLWDAFLETKGKNSRWRIETGALYPTMGKPYNKYLNMEYFLFRTPISQMSIFGHWIGQDKIFSEAEPLIRMPGYGLKLSGESGEFNAEVFSLYNDESPITINRVYNYGGARLGYNTARFRTAASMITSTQGVPRPTNGTDPNRRREDLRCIEAEYDIFPDCGLYGAFASSSFGENGLRSGNMYNGNATLFGLRGNLFRKRVQADLRYYSMDPNYEPLGQHKRSVYPTGYCGFRGEVRYYWKMPREKKDEKKQRNSISVQASNFNQLNPDVNTVAKRGGGSFAVEDYIFPDGGMPGIPNGSGGRISVFSSDFNIKFTNIPVEIGGYWERLHMGRSTDALGRMYCKDVDNLSIWMDYELTKTIELVAGYRQVDFSGNWYLEDSQRPFSQAAWIPKVGFIYDNDLDLKVSAQYHFYNYIDRSPSVKNSMPQNNNWNGGVFFFETSLSF